MVGLVPWPTLLCGENQEVCLNTFLSRHFQRSTPSVMPATTGTQGATSSSAIAKRTSKDNGDDPGGQAVASLCPRGVHLVQSIAGHKAPITSLAYSSDGEVLVSGDRDGVLKLWDAHHGQLIRVLKEKGSGIASLAFSPLNQTLVSGTADGSLWVWNLVSEGLPCQLAGHYRSVDGLAFTPDGKLFASGSRNGTVKLWDTDCLPRSGAVEFGIGSAISSLAFSPKVGVLAAGCTNGTVILQESTNRTGLRQLSGHKGIVTSVAFSPKDGALTSGSSDKTVKRWDVTSGRLLQTLDGHDARIDSIAFTPDGSLLASKSRDSTIRLWNCVNWQSVGVLEVPTRQRQSVSALAFSPTRSHRPLLAAASSNRDSPNLECSRLIQIWELDRDLLLGYSSI